MMKHILFAFFLVICSVVFGVGPKDVDAQYELYRNKLTNPGFENGKSTWSTSGSPTFSITTTSANVADGARAASFDAGAASDALISNSWTMEAGSQSQNCLARIRYMGGDSNLTFKSRMELTRWQAFLFRLKVDSSRRT